MPDLTLLQELIPLVRPHDLDDLRDVVRRRRRTAGLVSAATAGTVLAVVVAGASLGPRTATPAPVAPEPTVSTPTSSTPTATSEPTRSMPTPDSARGPFPALTPESIRSHPDATVEEDDYAVTAAPGVAARLWTVCLADCSRATTYQVREMQRALEVTSDRRGTSALYPYTPPEPNVSHVVDDWFALSSSDGVAVLVNSRGERRPLTLGSRAPVGDISGPLVLASEGLAYVDLEARRLHPLEGPGYWDWWGSGDTWFWGNVYVTDDEGDVRSQGLTWRDPDGTFGVRMLPIDFEEHSTQMLRSGRAGTMGAIDPSGPRRLLHVSTDYGDTWDVRVMPESWGTGTSLPAEWRTWVDVWPTWPSP
jgi:hypothetical protein